MITSHANLRMPTSYKNKGVVVKAVQTHMLSGMELGPPLANNNVTRDDCLVFNLELVSGAFGACSRYARTREFLYTETFAW